MEFPSPGDNAIGWQIDGAVNAIVIATLGQLKIQMTEERGAIAPKERLTGLCPYFIEGFIHLGLAHRVLSTSTTLPVLSNSSL